MGEPSVVYCFDEGFAQIALVSMCSLLESNTKTAGLSVYCVTLSVSEESKKKAKSLFAKYERTVCFIDGKEQCEKFRFWPEEKDNKYIVLLLHKLLEKDKILYLDCDTVVTATITNLWNTDLTDYWVAAVHDLAYPSYKLEANLDKESLYFNAGVMLINLAIWREKDILNLFEKAYSYATSYTFNFQRVLNNVCKGNTMYLPLKYNMIAPYYEFNSKQIYKLSGYVTSDEELREARGNNTIIHFANSRPWENICVHPMREVFYEYEKLVPIKVKRRKLGVHTLIKRIALLMLPFPVYAYLKKRKEGDWRK